MLEYLDPKVILVFLEIKDIQGLQVQQVLDFPVLGVSLDQKEITDILAIQEFQDIQVLQVRGWVKCISS